jgi:NAD(P)H-hydrate epimerase
MRSIDRWAIDVQGVPGLDLMERAGAATVRELESLAPEGAVTVLCGKGNNGGDGLVIARLLRDAGRPVTVLIAGSAEEISPEAHANLQRLPGEPPRSLQGAEIAGHGVVVDALLGTGFDGEPRGVVAEAIDAINAAQLPVLSVDAPSGVDASSGAARGRAVRATVTVSFHAGKPGLWIAPGKGLSGDVRVVDIGIPRGAPGGAWAGLIEPSILEVLPRRGADSTKFSSGQALVAGGSAGMTGAPALAGRAAARAGAGYVILWVPAAAAQAVAANGSAELMVRGLTDRDGAHTPEGVQDVLAACERAGALALGPGLGRSDGAVRFARTLAAQAPLPLVLDADGLNAHAGRLGDLADRGAPTVMTPHAGELGRLLGIESSEVERERLHHAREAAQRAEAILVLKGDDTLVVEPGGRVGISRGGSPALATAGTGDVLSGVIASLLAQGLDAFTAACAGVYLHAQAGRLAAARIGAAEGVIATDVIDSLPAARGSGQPPREGP